MKLLIVLSGMLLFFFSAKGQLPEIYLETTENEEVLISELQGSELTVVDFWATWCKPCLIAIPELVKIYGEFSDSGVSFIGINIDSPRNKAKIRPFAEARGITYPVLMDTDQEMMHEMNVVQVPTLIIFDKNGKQVFVHEGFNPGDQELLREKILELLK